MIVSIVLAGAVVEMFGIEEVSIFECSLGIAACIGECERERRSLAGVGLDPDLAPVALNDAIDQR